MENKFKHWTIQLLILLAIIYIATKVSFLFQPIGVFFSTIFAPLLISGFLFFIFNPVVKFMQKRLKLSRILSIIVLYLAIITLIAFAIGSVVPIITKQISSLISDIPLYARQLERFITDVSRSDELKLLLSNDYISLDDIQSKLVEFLNSLPNMLTNSFLGIFNFLTNAVITIVTVPILLFYMFKDGHRFPIAISKFIPKQYRDESLEVIEDVGETLSSYISGQVTVASIVGLLSLIGYWIIDLPYALLLALVVAVTNIIPYVGPILGAAPAVIIALFDSPLQAFLVVIVAVIAQQTEGNFLSPLILGKSLDIHPATVIILLLAAGNIAGILGMVLAVPTYAVTKTIALSIARFLKIRKEATTPPGPTS